MTFSDPNQTLKAFQQLDQWLFALADYWHFKPFCQDDYPWSKDSLLVQGLERMTDEPLQQSTQNWHQQLQLAQHWIEGLCPVPAVLAVEQLPAQVSLLDSRLNSGVPGRKWQQIKSFIGCLPMAQNSKVLDWCCGKGYLARSFASVYQAQQIQVSGLEWQPQLCEQGQHYAQQHQLPLQLHCADALSPQAAELLTAEQHCVALHACGDLHIQLLRQAVAQQCSRISLSPCCYHLTAAACYQPLSLAGQQAQVQLSKFALSLPLQALVTAGARKRRLRDQELLWRIAFDELLRWMEPSAAYQPLGRIAESALNQPFIAFCRQMAACQQLSLPAVIPDAKILQQAQQRVQKIRRMEWVQTLFKHAIEIWLLLDKVLFLQQSGYQVRWGMFCERPVTPRNLMLDALFLK